MQAARFLITAATAIAVVGSIGFVYAQSSDADSNSAKPMAAPLDSTTTTGDSSTIKDSPASDTSTGAEPAAAPLAPKADRN